MNKQFGNAEAIGHVNRLTVYHKALSVTRSMRQEKNSSHGYSCLLQVRSFGRQLLESISYLHDLNLIHTDLKPENILLQSLEYDKLDSSSR